MSVEKWEPVTCRACLVTDVRMFNIHEIGMAGLFGFISNSAVEPGDGLPQHVCYYCRGQLEKFKEFRTKCRQSTSYFENRLQMSVHSPESGVIAGTALRETQMIRMVAHNFDKSMSPSGPLSKTETFILDYIPNENILENNECEEINVNIYSYNCLRNDRKECDDLTNCDGDDKRIINVFDDVIVFDDDDDVGLSVKSELVEDIDVTAEALKEIKKEQDTISNNIKEMSDAKTRKKIGRNTKTKKEQDKKPKRKKCNKYNEKFEEDFVEFSKTHDVKVVCLSKEEQIKKVLERKESKEYKDSRFTCAVCYKWFMSETAHKRHMKAHDPSGGAFVCDVCHMRYPTQRNLNTHKRTHRKIFMCTLCDQANISITRAKLHSRWHKGVKFECGLCQKQFNANTTYLSHMREVHKPARCEQCGEHLRGTNELNKHRSTLHRDNQNECERCGVVFQTAHALDRHKASDNGCAGKGSLKLKPCLLCGESFSCRGSLSEHMRGAHSGNEAAFTCEQCHSVFTSDRALSAHFANAHYTLKPRAHRQPPKEYLCECCAKSFPTALRLKQHHRLHSDERPFQCSLCPKRLKTKAGLEFHINSHTGLRPYKCRVCSETFKSHAHRHNHLVMKHTTRERRHKCQSCDKSFVTSSDLKKHVRYVHLRHPRPHQPKLGKTPLPQDVE